MSKNVMLIQKNSRLYSKVLLVLIIIISIFGALNLFRLIYAGMQNSSSFFISENTDVFNELNYYLTINKKDFFGISLEKIQTSMETYLPNYKATYMITVSTTLTNQIILILMLFTVFKMLKDITKKGSAFIRSNTIRLRLISVFILALVFIPAVLNLTANFLIFLYASAAFTFNDILLIFIGIAVWGISYVMDYGCELQKEVDETL